MVVRLLPGQRETRVQRRVVKATQVASPLAVSLGMKGMHMDGTLTTIKMAINPSLSLSPSLPFPLSLPCSGDSGTEEDDRQKPAAEEGGEEEPQMAGEPSEDADGGDKSPMAATHTNEDSSDNEAMQVDTAPAQKESSSEESE